MNSNIIKKKYYKDGYLYKFRAISEQSAKKILNEFDQNNYSTQSVLKEELCFRPDMVFKSFRDLAENKKILRVVEKILGKKIVCWYSMIFYKNNKNYVSFHQDLKYWKFKNDKCLTVSLALTKSNVRNGCLSVINGSHNKNFKHNSKLFDKKNLLASNQSVNISSLPKPFMFILSPGEFTVHHGDILHGSFPNLTNNPRVLCALRYCAVDNPSEIYKYGIYPGNLKKRKTKNFKSIPNFNKNFSNKLLKIRESLIKENIKYQLQRKIKNKLISKIITLLLTKKIRSVFYKFKNI